ncbi:hypothetical protein ABIA24_004593 [Sinorhizobium fredii]
MVPEDAAAGSPASADVSIRDDWGLKAYCSEIGVTG